MMTFVSLLTLRVFSSTCKPQGNVMAMMMMVMVVMMMIMKVLNSITCKPQGEILTV